MTDPTFSDIYEAIGSLKAEVEGLKNSVIKLEKNITTHSISHSRRITSLEISRGKFLGALWFVGALSASGILGLFMNYVK